jgi:hypothetical protein
VGSRLWVAEADTPAVVVGSRVVVVDIPAVADSRVEPEDSRVVGEDNNRLVEADNLAAVVGSRVVAADIQAVADSRVEVEDSRAVGEDNNRPVEEDNRAVAGDSNRPVVAARRRTSYRTGRRTCCPG